MHIKLDENRPEVKGMKDNSGKNVKRSLQDECFGESLRRSIGYESMEAGATVHKDIRQTAIITSSKVPESAVCNRESVELSLLKGQEIKEVEVRNLSYEECDRVKINLLEGYTLKAKLERELTESKEPAGIYVEMKNDEGDTRAFLFNTSGHGEIKEEIMEQLVEEIGKDRA